MSWLGIQPEAAFLVQLSEINYNADIMRVLLSADIQGENDRPITL